MNIEFEKVSALPEDMRGRYQRAEHYKSMCEAFEKLADGEALRIPGKSLPDGMRMRVRIYSAFRRLGYRNAQIALRGTDVYIIKRD